MEQVNTIKYEYNNRTKRYTFYTNKAQEFKKAITKLLGKTSTNLLFVKDSNTRFDFYDFFLLEFEYCLNLMKEEEHLLAIDIGGVTLNDMLTLLNTRTWLADRVPMDNKKLFDFNNLKKNMKFMPMEHQITAFDKYEDVKRLANLRGGYLDMAPGSGKAVSVTTPIKIKGGWRPIGTIKKGDMVIGRDGNETMVTAIYPQGIKQLYKVTFADGRYVNTCEEHLWDIKTYNYRSRHKNKIYKYRNYVLKPFILGLMLGSKQLDVNITLPNLDNDIINKVFKHLTTEFTVVTSNNTLSIKHTNTSITKSAILRQLRILGLETYDLNIRLPRRYLSGLIIQRHELLDGLITGGNISTDKSYAKLICDNIDFAKDLQDLVKSINGTSYIDNVPNSMKVSISIYLNNITPIEENKFIVKNFKKIDTRMESKIISTGEIMKYLESKKNNVENISRYFIDLPTPSDFKLYKYDIEPYLLGALIGDGHIPNLTIANISSYFYNKVETYLPTGYILKRIDKNTFRINLNKEIKAEINLKHSLKMLGLLSCRSWEKFIPTEYLEGSLEQRYELLRGLMDTDGEVGKGGHASYSTTSEQLADDVQLLIRSLGGICSISSRYTYYTYKGEKKRGRLSYRLNIRMSNTRDIVTLPKRLDRLKEVNQYSENLKLRVVSVDKIHKEEAVCISVDNEDKLYVVKDYIVTHNTYSSLALSDLLDYDLTIIVAPKNTLDEVWMKSVTESLYKRKQTYVILGTDSKVYNNEKFIITHYQYLDKLVKDKKLARRIKKIRPMLIIDEFHNFNEIKSERTNILLNFVKYINFQDVVLLSGTPIKMNVKELVPMLYILDSKFPKVVDIFKQFYNSIHSTKVDLIRHRFNLYRERVENTDPNLGEAILTEHKIVLPDGDDYTMENINRRMESYKHERLAELHRDMELYETQFYKYLSDIQDMYLKDNLNYVEAKKNITRYKSLVKQIRKASDNSKLYLIYPLVTEASLIEKEILLPKLRGIDKHTFKSVRSIVKYPKLKVLGEALGKILLGDRIKCYTKLAANIDYRKLLLLTNKKGLIFSNYISVCETAFKAVKQQGYNPIGVYGELVDDLTNSVKLFNDLTTNTNPIIATYKSLSTGVPLPSANIIIMLDVPMRSYALEQALSRAYRTGNHHDVLAFFVKLDTGDKFNITERDLYIVNTSEYNVELITGTKPVFDTPKQEIPLEESLVSEEIEEELEEELLNEFNKLHLQIANTPLEFIKQFMKKIRVI